MWPLPRRNRSPIPRSCLLAAVALGLFGCNSARTPTVAKAVNLADPAAELTESLRDQLRKSLDLAGCKRVVDQLNAYLLRAEPDKKPRAFAPDALANTTREFGLKPAETAEIARGEFSALDAYYLQESLLARDAVQAMNLDRIPPIEQVQAILRWVVRHVRLIEVGSSALPPEPVLLRGYGNARERLLVFLTLLRQTGFDAFVLGEPGGQSGVWAVGVPIERQVYLFDPALGLPLTDPSGQGILTLETLKKPGDPFQAMRFGNLSYSVSPDQARRAVPLLAPPLSSLAPRMRFLEQLLRPGTVRLAFDPALVRTRLAESAGLAESALNAWNAPIPDNSLRALMTFVPVADGGSDAAPPGERRVDRMLRDSVPWTMLPPDLLNLQGDPGNRIRAAFAQRLLLFSQPGMVRDQLVRGRFDEATKTLVEVQESAGRQRRQFRDLDKPMREWADLARAYYAEASRRERAAAKGEVGFNSNLEELRVRMETLWRDPAGPQNFLNELASEPLLAESTYLLAICKQDQAEVLLHHPDAASALPAAWQSAYKAWNRFLTSYSESPAALPAKMEQARILEQIGRPAEAKTLYASLVEKLRMPEQLACKIRASRLK